MTQDGAQKLIENTLVAKTAARDWRSVAIVLADALAALDVNDIEVDIEPYRSAVQIADFLKEDKLLEVLKIIKSG